MMDQDTLKQNDLNKDPLKQFTRWYTDALKSEGINTDSVTLATANKHGHPSARIVLFKGLYQAGFRFFTNYSSPKAQDLAENPQASIVFYWPNAKKQICIEGAVEKLSHAENLNYFHSRPRQSQIGAWASHQSQIIDSRKILEDKFKVYEADFENLEEIPLPDHWGGYVLTPSRIEFWHDRAYRLHDRFLYEREAENWIIHRLAP